MIRTVLFILIFLCGLLTGCNSPQTHDTKEATKPSNNYFSRDGEIMLKLYKTVGTEILYWETWNTDNINAVIHWGKLGDTGESEEIHMHTAVELQKEINASIELKKQEGFKEIPYDFQYTLQINFKLKTWGTSEDINRREEVRDIVTEHLGWTGNGRCDDADIGSGEMSLFAEVIDPQLAIKTLTKEFKDKNVTDEYYFEIIPGDSVVSARSKPD